MSNAFADDTDSEPAEAVRRALEDYAATYREVVRIAADGGSEEEIADLAGNCFASAGEIRPVEAHDPPAPLLRELYESLLVLSGVQRVADTLSLPVATCANGKSLRPFLERHGELSVWYRSATGGDLESPAIPESLVRRDVRDSSPTAYLRWPRRRLAANVDRGADRTIRETDLTRIFASRLTEALQAYRDPAPDGAGTTAVARRFAPVLIGFARLADRQQAGLRAPEGASALARLVVDALVAGAAGRPTEREISDAAAPLRDWLSAD
jgi:hypothetical protein